MMYEQGVQAKETPGLEDYLAAIRQRKWLIVVFTILGIAASVAFTSTRTNTYTASAKVLVNPTNVASRDGRLVDPVLEREREVIASNAVARLVAEELDVTTSPLLLLRNLDVVFVDDSDSLELRYDDSDPETAQDVVNSFAQNYVDKRVGEANDLDAVVIAELTDQIEVIDARIAEEQVEIDTLGADAERKETAGLSTFVEEEALRLARDNVANLRAERRSLNEDLTAAVISQNTRTPPAEVLQFADLPSFPIGLSDNIIRGLGLIVGVGSGAALAFVLHRLDRTARESADVELALGTSVLASIPPFGFAHRTGTSSVVMLAGGRSARVQQAREAFRRLRSSLQFLGTSRDAESFLITSARPAEGKSTTAANVAVALSQGSIRVCLVSADLRRPMLEKILGVPNSRGLSDWLADPTVTDIMVPVPSTPGLVLVPAGPPPPNPGELLATGRIEQLIDELEGQFDIVLLDAPPILSAADASSLSSSVDGTIIVVDASRTDTDTLLRVRAEVERAGGSVAGAILNRDSTDTGTLFRRDRYAYEKVSASRAAQ